MFYPLSLFIGLRYTQAKKSNGFVSFVSLFSTGGILIGVMALVTVLSVMNGFEEKQKVRILGAIPHVIYSNDKQQLTDWQDKVTAFKQLPHVDAVAGIVTAEALAQTPTGLEGVQVQGVFPDKHPANERVSQSMLVGDFSDLTAGSYQVVVGRQLAKKLGVTLGDKIRLMSSKGSVFTPLGRMPSQRNFTVSGMFEVGAEADSLQVFIHAEDAARLMRMPKGSVSGIRFYLDDPFQLDAFDQYPLPSGEHFTDWRSSHGQFFQAVKMEKSMIGILLCLIVAVAAFNILSSSVMLVTDKESEVAILKTLGLNNQNIIAIFMVQGAWSGVLGAIVGAITGLLLSININPVLSAIGLNLYAAAGQGGQLPVLFDPVQIAFIIIGAMTLSLAATFYPAWRAARVKPAEALRYE